VLGFGVELSGVRCTIIPLVLNLVACTFFVCIKWHLASRADSGVVSGRRMALETGGPVAG